MLQLVKEKYEYKGDVITKYENAGYLVFLVEDTDGLEVRVQHKEFSAPKIYADSYNNLTINVPSTGSLTLKEAMAHTEQLTLALSTVVEIEELVKKYKF